MKKFMKFFIPILLIAVIISSIGWYLFVFDREFTRDLLLNQARLNDLKGNTRVSAWFYNLAYVHSGKDENVAIELANQYKSDGNYTKAEVTLCSAINSDATAELYTALCKAYVDQDKLMDAAALLASIPDPAIRAQLEQERPTAPKPDQVPGLYSSYIHVGLSSSSGTIYYTTDGEYPSIASTPFTEPIALSGGETVISCISVAESGLVSPVSILGYTVGGVIEPAVFTSAQMELHLREQLGIPERKPIFTNDLWTVTEFTLPDDVDSLDDLAQLPYLEKLTVQGRSLNSLDVLSGLTHLQSLDLSRCRFPSEALGVLSKLPELNTLILHDCSLSTIAALEGCTALKTLDISNNTIRNLDVLSDMTGLSQLLMHHNAINQLKPLTSLANLEKLDIAYNAVTELTPLASCAKLTWLNAASNQLQSAKGISSLPLLTTLALDYNRLESVEALEPCTQLTELSISNNAISDISKLGGLVHLEIFDFSYNDVEALPQWPEGCALRVLEGSYNAVSNINVLASMNNLTYVSMEYNKLTNVNALADCYNLVQVNVYGNEIKNVTALTDNGIIVNYDPT